MEEIIVKMVFCLLVALGIGFLFGWFIKRAFEREKHSAIVENLIVDLDEKKDIIMANKDELDLVKEQFINVKNELDRSSGKSTELEESLLGYKTKVMALEGTLTDKEIHIKEIGQESGALRTKLSNSNKELDIIRKKSQQQEEEISRIKEHHTLLQNQVHKLSQEKSTQAEKFASIISDNQAKESKIAALTSKIQETDNLHIMISDYKSNEKKLLDEKKAYENKLSEVTSTLNNKNMASIELHTKIKEIDTLNQKNSELSSQLNQAKINQQKAEEKTLTYKNTLKDLEAKVHKVGQQETENDEGFFDKLTHAKEDISNSMKTSTHKVQSKSEGFDFIKFAKKTLDKITETGDDINAKADKVIQDYKDRK